MGCLNKFIVSSTPKGRFINENINFGAQKHLGCRYGSDYFSVSQLYKFSAKNFEALFIVRHWTEEQNGDNFPSYFVVRGKAYFCGGKLIITILHQKSQCALCPFMLYSINVL